MQRYFVMELGATSNDACGAVAQGLWMHGNLIAEIPKDIGALTNLRTFVVHGNRLTALPDSISALCRLTELGVAGNRLSSLPPDIGALGAFLQAFPGPLLSP